MCACFRPSIGWSPTPPESDRATRRARPDGRSGLMVGDSKAGVVEHRRAEASSVARHRLPRARCLSTGTPGLDAE
jgi:hypothetical protein